MTGAVSAWSLADLRGSNVYCMSCDFLILDHIANGIWRHSLPLWISRDLQSPLVKANGVVKPLEGRLGLSTNTSSLVLDSRPVRFIGGEN